MEAEDSCKRQCGATDATLSVKHVNDATLLSIKSTTPHCQSCCVLVVCTSCVLVVHLNSTASDSASTVTGLSPSGNPPPAALSLPPGALPAGVARLALCGILVFALHGMQPAVL